MPDNAPPPMFPYQPGPFDPIIGCQPVVCLIPPAAWLEANQAAMSAGTPVTPPPPEECNVGLVIAATVQFPSVIANPTTQKAALLPVNVLGQIKYTDLMRMARAGLGRPETGE